MKKVFSLLLAVVLVASMFVGCQSGAALKDGTYKATYSNPSHGWIDFLEVTIKDGKIADVDFDATNEAGDLKSENQDYEDNMSSANAEAGLPAIGPMEFFAEYEKALIGAQDINKVTAVAGASHALDNLKELYAALSKKMATGDTTEAVIDNSEK